MGKVKKIGIALIIILVIAGIGIYTYQHECEALKSCKISLVDVNIKEVDAEENSILLKIILKFITRVPSGLIFGMMG